MADDGTLRVARKPGRSTRYRASVVGVDGATSQREVRVLRRPTRLTAAVRIGSPDLIRAVLRDHTGTPVVRRWVVLRSRLRGLHTMRLTFRGDQRFAPSTSRRLTVR